MRILLVEDDEDDYVLVRDALQALGPGRMTLEWIEDAEQALAAMTSDRHDVCLLDYRLGAYTGLELLEQARQGGSHIPVILLTGIEDKAADQRALEAGAADFLVKSQMTPVLLERTIRYTVEHARTLEALRRSQASFRALIERLPDGISVWQDGRLIYANPEFLRLAGVESAQELLGKTAKELSAFVHPEDFSRLMRLSAAPPTEHPMEEIRFQRKDGAFIPVEAALFSVTFEGRSCKMGVARDLTERKQMQARLTAADRMATLGMAAGIVAHDINNPLAYVLTNLHHLSADVLPRLGMAEQEREEVRTLLADVQFGATRAREIVQQFRIFSSGEKDVRIEPVDVRRVIESALRMSLNAIRHRARLVRDDAEPLAVMANEGQLGQVVLNLLINAAQAIPEGDVEHNEVRIVTRCRGHEVHLEVHDTGGGIPKDQHERIFDPFFTTKPKGVGTGLGLSICRGLVTSLGGRLELQSEVGRGSVFRVVLPSATKGATRTPTPAPVPRAITRRGRILIVDDEPMVGTAIRRALQREHEVLALTSAREAQARLERGEQYDLILCDIMMPEMSGMDLHGALSRRAPALAERMVFLTGGAFTPEAREFLRQVKNRCVEKPFLPHELRELVQSLLVMPAR